MPHLIRCRARVVATCYDGRPTSVQFGEDLPMTEDGTFLPTQGGGSLVCDPCYINLGTPLNADLEQAISARKGRAR